MNIEIQPDLEDPLMKEIQDHVRVCFQCQTCTSGCPVFRALPKFKPSNIAQQLAREGTVPYIGDMPAYWICAGCYSCETKCPQGVDLAHIFFKLKNWAVENNGPVPKGILSEASTMKTGVTVPINQSVLARREKLGLPELPKPNIGEIDKILNATKFQKKLDNLLNMEVSK
ncbi:MAG: 4Fe-4S dicluster domain-containing protein [Candidatus Thorarchaeota archaeon]